jgi:uncharacterized sporulation protein YeaH/YhbH (DUF444 family)
MSRIATFLFTAVLLLGADDSWKKVQDLKSHSELRIYKKGTREALNATLDEANEDRIVVVVKNKQVAIPKEDIDRIDARPGKTPRKVNVDSTTKETDPDLTPHPNPAIPVPGTSSSSTVSVGGDGRPGFETIYRRVEGAPKK